MEEDATGRPHPKPVLDASVAIGLSKIGRFGLLQQISSARSQLTETVLHEVLAKEVLPGAPEVKEATDAGWAEAVAVETDPSFSNLGAGEAATLTLCAQDRRTGPLGRSNCPLARFDASNARLGHCRRIGRCEARGL